MDETGMLDYFYGNEAEQFEFLQVPMILVKDPIYHQGKTALNSDAILLYSFMLNRAKLSRKNTTGCSSATPRKKPKKTCTGKRML